MQGAEFKKLAFMDQIEYVNNRLQQGESVDSIRKSLGISKNYIASNFGKRGYKRDSSNQYVLYTEGTEGTESTESTDKVKVLAKDTLESRVQQMEQQLKQVQQMLEVLQNNTVNTVNTVNTNGVCEAQFLDSKDVVSRVYKIDKDVQEQFKIFCKKHSNTKVQDIISTALLEFIQKYS